MIEVSNAADIRFGYGLGPGRSPLGAAGLLAGLAAPDLTADRFPVVSMQQALSLDRAYRDAGREARQGIDGAQDRADTARTTLREAERQGLRAVFARILDGRAPLRERLTWFWADHFTVAPRGLSRRAAGPAFVEEAIRPHVTGSFAEMLKAVMRHPTMLVYLDQHVSVGPDSPVAEATGRGLNENLARELLELHTVGLDGGYTQADLREAAELLTGLTMNRADGFRFRPGAAQPGAETVLGQSYGGPGRARLSDIDAFLDDLALHPATVRHLARKLAVHFVSDQPAADLLGDLEDSYRATNGNLMAVTEVLLTHRATAATPLGKIKWPMEFIGSALVALGTAPETVFEFNFRRLNRFVARPMGVMGQPFLRAPGPDGWSEAPEAWITPQGLAARISWAADAAEHLGRHITDPVGFLDRTLPGLGDAGLRFAVSAAETRSEAIAMVLASIAFNRR